MKLLSLVVFAMSFAQSSQAYEGLWQLAGGQGDCTLQLWVGQTPEGDYILRGGQSPFSPLVWTFSNINEGEQVSCPGYDDCDASSTFNKYKVVRNTIESSNIIQEQYQEFWTKGPKKGEVNASVSMSIAPFGISIVATGHGQHANGQKFKAFDCQYY